MFEIGDYVVNAANGICQIREIVQMDLSGSKKPKDYFLLVPVEEESAKVYIPVDISERRIRKVITGEEAWRFIERIPEMEEVWIDNEKERERKYKQVVLSCDLEQLIGIIKNMYHRMQKRSEQGKKNTAVDERYFKLAENHLYAELAFALDKNKTDMRAIIEEHIVVK